MFDTVGTGTVYCCRSDQNNFENLRFHFGVKICPFYVNNSHFQLLGLRPRRGPNCNQMPENHKKLDT